MALLGAEVEEPTSAEVLEVYTGLTDVEGIPSWLNLGADFVERGDLTEFSDVEEGADAGDDDTVVWLLGDNAGG